MKREASAAQLIGTCALCKVVVPRHLLTAMESKRVNESTTRSDSSRQAVAPGTHTASSRLSGGVMRVGAASVAFVSLLLAGCATSAPANGATPAPRGSPATAHSATPSAAPVHGSTEAVMPCCTATIPPSWTSPTKVGNGVEGSSDPTGRLYVSWQVVGTAHSCPAEPMAFLSSLTSPAHPAADVISGVDPLTIHGHWITVYVAVPSNSGVRNYQYLNADAVIGAECLDLGGAEYGDASPSNVALLLRILATTAAISSSTQTAGPK
jgi:hypothetical protein